jgi:hypothetical protein
MTRWLALALLVCSSLAAPLGAGAQTAARVYRVGILSVPEPPRGFDVATGEVLLLASVGPTVPCTL